MFWFDFEKEIKTFKLFSFPQVATNAVKTMVVAVICVWLFQMMTMYVLVLKEKNWLIKYVNVRTTYAFRKKTY